MHSFVLDRIPSQEMSSRTIVSLTRCLVKKRLVEVAPIILFLSYYCCCYWDAVLTVESEPPPINWPSELLVTDVLRLSPLLSTLPPNIGSYYTFVDIR